MGKTQEQCIHYSRVYATMNKFLKKNRENIGKHRTTEENVGKQGKHRETEENIRKHRKTLESRKNHRKTEEM